MERDNSKEEYSIVANSSNMEYWENDGHRPISTGNISYERDDLSNDEDNYLRPCARTSGKKNGLEMT